MKNQKKHKFFSEFGREHGCLTRDLSDLLYNGKLDKNKLVIVNGRRAIPADYEGAVLELLTRKGRIRPELKEPAPDQAASRCSATDQTALPGEQAAEKLEAVHA